MSYWFSKKGQAYSIPYTDAIKANGRSYEVFKYHKDGKTILVLASIKNYYIEFPYHEALFFYLGPDESYLTGIPIRALVVHYFRPEWKKRMEKNDSLV